MPESPQLATVSGKGKAPQPTDIAEKLYALQRKQAQMVRLKERPERPQVSSASTSRAPPVRSSSPRRLHAPPLPNPNIVVSQPQSNQPDTLPDEHDFSRRLKISPTSPRASHRTNGSPIPNGKLFDPNGESRKRNVITAEPDAMSDAASSSYAPRVAPPTVSRPHQSSQPTRGGEGPRLFDPRKDNPHKFLPRPPGQAPPSALSNRPTPTPKSSGDYISASSTSSASYAHSTISSNFTLSSTTTDSSTGSALFDNARRSEESTGPSGALSMQLKRTYRNITTLEDRIKTGDRDRERDDEVDRDGQRMGVLMLGRQANGIAEVRGDEEAEKERWKQAMNIHKEYTELMHHLLKITLAPTVPASLRNIPIKYNIIIRLWTYGFHQLLESLRQAAMPPTSSVVALEHLQDFIYHAYTFYTLLLEERNLGAFRSAWLEALGDLARYRIAVSAMVDGAAASSTVLTSATSVTRPLASAHLTPRPNTPLGQQSAISDKAASPTPAARIDDSPPPSAAAPAANPHRHLVPSVGIAAARMMVLEPEKERWRQIAKGWFAKGLATTPGAGKLHHHLGILSRDKEGYEEELRAVYHFVKSMITLHPFNTSREAILQLWSIPAQSRRQAPDARLSELFIALQGMLFTNIQLDDFKGVLGRFEEKLNLEGGEVIEEKEWIMMAIINIGAILEFGRPTAVLRRVAGVATKDGMPMSSPAIGNGATATGKVKLMMVKKTDGDDKKMDVDDEEDGGEGISERVVTGIQLSPAMAGAIAGEQLPLSLKLALQLTFTMLAHALRHPTHQATPFARQTLNPYITIILTFLSTVLKDRHTFGIMERSIPWDALASFFNTIPRRLLNNEQQKERSEGGGLLLTSGCTPLPEDWCLRGLGWGGKKVFERGFWGKDAASGEEKNVEVEVLDRCVGDEQMMDGIIEDEDDEDGQAKQHSDPGRQEMHGRWIRVARAGLKLGKIVNGLVFVPPTTRDGRGEWRVEGVLADKVARWKEEARREAEEEERRLRGTRWVDDDSMDVDDEENIGIVSSEESEDDDEDSDQVKALKARRRYLQSLVESSQRSPVPRRRPRGQTTKKSGSSRSTLHVVPGYTILIVDTNILLSSLSIIASLVESLKWTIIIPLPVIMELDGISSNVNALGEAASAASSYINTHIRSHLTSLKIQTSRGNYLANLNVRTEMVDFGGDEQSWERNYDDLILRAAIWQKEHWVDRSAFLKDRDSSFDMTGASRVVLLSFDRMLRLKARSRELDAANEQDLAAILAVGT
ncbi:hypothetical protein ABKN59_003762 [Abortiporus biennis]